MLADKPAAAGPEDARRVRLVDHQHGSVSCRRCGDLGKRREVAVHAEYGFGDDQPAPGGFLCQQFLEMRDIVVPETQERGAAERDGIDQAGVHELVGEDRVVAAHDGGNDAGIGQESAAEQQRGRIALEVGDSLFEFLVEGKGPGDQPGRRGARAELIERTFRGGDDTGMCRKAQVIVA